MLASIAGQARFLSGITENTLQLVRLASGPLRRDSTGSRSRRSSAASSARLRDRAVRRAHRGSTSSRCAAAGARRRDPAGPAPHEPARQRLQVRPKGRSGSPCAAPERRCHPQRHGSGPGVRPEDEARLFEPFFRGEAQAPGHGAGLGLALCKAIAEAHRDARRTPTPPGRQLLHTRLPLEPQPEAGG